MLKNNTAFINTTNLLSSKSKPPKSCLTGRQAQKHTLEIWEQMKANSFLNYSVGIKKQEEHIEDFKQLSLKEQKHHLCELLDKNQLYVNLSSLTDFTRTEEEKKVTQDFYQ